MNNRNLGESLHSDKIIKICGLREPDNIRKIAALTPMLMGFIFYDKSPRYAGDLDPAVVRNLPTYVRPVAVFVNATEEEIDSICSKYGIRIIQLHGNESPEFCRKMQDKGYIVFKAIGIGEEKTLDKIKKYEGNVTLFLFDTATPAHGGSGKKFDWSILDHYPFDTPYLLSGGIGPDDVDSIVAAVRPMMAGIDVNSAFEDEPGIKNIRKLLNFILTLRKYNETEPSSVPFWEKR